MKEAATVIGLLGLLFSSCVTPQKKLQRRIEKNGIKESIVFVRQKYPEYFKAVAVTVHDTVTVNDTIRIKADTVNVFLKDSNGVLSFSDSLVSITVNKATNEAKIIIKEREVIRIDTVSVSVACPEIICPDCDSLQDNTEKNPIPVWVWLLIGIVSGAIGLRIVQSKS